MTPLNLKSIVQTLAKSTAVGIVAIGIFVAVEKRTNACDSTLKEGHYRRNYERAIRYGGFKRPSLVNSWQESYSIGNQYYKEGNTHLASIRFAQMAVILEDQRGTKQAEIAVRSNLYGAGINNTSYLSTFNSMFTPACVQRQQEEFGL